MNQRLQAQTTKLDNSDRHNKSTNRPRLSLCQAGQTCQVDGVVFELLSSDMAEIGKSLKTDNDLSCVLKVTAGGQFVLIASD